ncbi:MAG: LysR family transcriptional regulator, regulator for metE and metH [Betaproteobacteria bacterium]
MIEVRHLRSLVAIADTRKIASAADRVHLTQSALSHQIRAVEKHYGVSLFERSRDGVRFTQAGERLLSAARDVIARIAEAEREVIRLKDDTRGELRIALECHTCFDWLMPVMDEFRRRWPEVEVDLVAGFHPNPIELLSSGKADLVIGSRPANSRAYSIAPLFRFEIVLVIAHGHRLRTRRRIDPEDVRGDTLITYPVPPQRIDFIREVLEPAGVKLQRRTAELTIAILQLVASRRGIAALPSWGVKSYVDHDYVLAKRIGAKGLWSDLYAIVGRAQSKRPYMADFLGIIRQICASELDRIELL